MLPQKHGAHATLSIKGILNMKLDTIAIHAGYLTDLTTKSVAC